MKIKLEDKLIDYMKSKNQRDLVMIAKPSKGSCCGGPFVNIKVRFATDEDQDLLLQGYVTSETELGVIYYHPEKVILGKHPKIILNQFLNMVVLQAMDIGTTEQCCVRGIPI